MESFVILKQLINNLIQKEKKDKEHKDKQNFNTSVKKSNILNKEELSKNFIWMLNDLTPFIYIRIYINLKEEMLQNLI